METNEGLRATVLARLLESFEEIRSGRVCTCGLWIAGEYSLSQPDIEAAIQVLFSFSGPWRLSTVSF